MSQQQQTRKRPPQYKINQRQPDHDDQANALQNDQDKPISPITSKTQPISDRKIYQVKKDSSTNSQQKANFKLSTFDNLQDSEKQKSQDKVNLFTPNDNPKTSENKSFFNFPINGVGLFSNLSNKSLFTSNQGTEASSTATANKPQTLNTTGLFGGNIFENKGLEGKKIFNFDNKIPQIKAGTQPSGFLYSSNQQEGSGDEAELEAAQKLEIDKSKSSGKYNYESNSTIIIKKQAKKYRKNNHDVIEGVQIQIQTDKENKNYWLVARIPATKNMILMGYIIKGVSKLRNISGKKQNIEITVLSIKNNPRSKEEKDNLQKNIIRLQFNETKDAEELQSQLQKLI